MLFLLFFCVLLKYISWRVKITLLCYALLCFFHNKHQKIKHLSFLLVSIYLSISGCWKNQESIKNHWCIYDQMYLFYVFDQKKDKKFALFFYAKVKKSTTHRLASKSEKLLFYKLKKKTYFSIFIDLEKAWFKLKIFKQIRAKSFLNSKFLRIM